MKNRTNLEKFFNSLHQEIILPTEMMDFSVPFQLQRENDWDLDEDDCFNCPCDVCNEG